MQNEFVSVVSSYYSIRVIDLDPTSGPFGRTYACIHGKGRCVGAESMAGVPSSSLSSLSDVCTEKRLST